MNMEKDDLATANLQTAFLHIQAKARKKSANLLTQYFVVYRFKALVY